MSLPEIIEQTRQKIGLSAVASGGPQPHQKNLNFNMQSQQHTMWCWAAVSVSVAVFYDKNAPWSQCVMVNQELGKSICCKQDQAQRKVCNKASKLETALRRAGHLNSFTVGS